MPIGRARCLRRTCWFVVLAWILLITPATGFRQADFRAMAATIADRLALDGNPTVAVVDFTDLDGNATELGRFIAEELSVALAGSRKIRVIDRGHLRTLLHEHKLASSGLVDSKTAQRLGRIAGVEVLVTGSLTPFSESVRISVKALNAGSAETLFADMMEIPRTKTFDELLARQLGLSPSRPGASTDLTGRSSRGASGGADGKSHGSYRNNFLQADVTAVDSKGGLRADFNSRLRLNRGASYYTVTIALNLANLLDEDLHIGGQFVYRGWARSSGVARGSRCCRTVQATSARRPKPRGLSS